MIYTKIYQSPIGKLFLAAENEALIGLWIQGQKYFPEKLFSGQVCGVEPAGEDCGILARTGTWLNQYFAGERPGPEQLKMTPGADLGILPPVSDFRQQVWKLLLEIPYGEVVTYGELASRLARQRGLPGMSAQAVGGAVGHNPISIIIPCHRVVGAGGSLTGYAGGVERKRRLLKLEGVLVYRPRGEQVGDGGIP